MPDITTIIGELKKVGALIPGDLWEPKCLDAQDALLDEIRKTEILTHTEGLEAVKRKDWVAAADSVQKHNATVRQLLLAWSSQCACVKKGDILENIAEGINVPSPMQISDTDKAATWTNIMLKLSDSKIITPEEANDLISNW